MKSYDHMVRHVNKRKARSVKAMSGCLDRVDCSCECLEPAKEWLKPKRNMIASIISGTLVSVLSNYNLESSYGVIKGLVSGV